MTSTEIFPIDDAFPDGAWNEFLKKHPGVSTVFHTREWMKTLQVAFGYESMCILALGDDEGSFHAALPFMADVRYGIWNYFSMPFDTYGSALGRFDYIPGLVEDFLNLPGLGVRYYVDFTSLPRAGEITVTTEIMDLSPAEQEIWCTMHKDNRTAIRAARKNGIEVGVALRHHDVFNKVPTQLSQAIVDIMIPSGRCIQLVAMLGGEIVAASLFFLYGDTMMYWANAVTPIGRRTNANYLLMWEAIRAAKLKGCTRMNFGASPAGADNLVRFKKSWGTTTHFYVKRQRVSCILRPVITIREMIHHG